MAKIIAVTNQKGGVGKTTTAVNLSALLSELGQKTLLVDLDPQGNASSGLGITAGESTIYEVLMGAIPFSACIQATRWPRLSVAASDIRLAGAELELVDVERREYRLKNAIAAVRDSYDMILIDCPPSLSLLTLNALSAADSVLIPIQCEYYALEGVTSLMNTIGRVRRSLNTSLVVEGVLLTMLDGRTNLGLQVVDQVKRHFKKQVFSVTIPRSVRLSEAPSHSEPIHIYDPKSTGAVAYRQLALEILSRNDRKPLEEEPPEEKVTRKGEKATKNGGKKKKKASKKSDKA
ncbi:MAG: ParA family protein [Clostridia bacterium]|nr:ParA family protein [Clostridia bacterium]